jgi:hypothetical protein
MDFRTGVNLLIGEVAGKEVDRSPPVSAGTHGEIASYHLQMMNTMHEVQSVKEQASLCADHPTDGCTEAALVMPHGVRSAPHGAKDISGSWHRISEYQKQRLRAKPSFSPLVALRLCRGQQYDRTLTPGTLTPASLQQLAYFAIVPTGLDRRAERLGIMTSEMMPVTVDDWYMAGVIFGWQAPMCTAQAPAPLNDVALAAYLQGVQLGSQARVDYDEQNTYAPAPDQQTIGPVPGGSISLEEATRDQRELLESLFHQHMPHTEVPEYETWYPEVEAPLVQPPL